MFLIARRYLLSAKSHSVVNIISLVSLFSLLIPVAAVIVLLSVFNGFGSIVGDLNRAVEGDLTISLREGDLFSDRDIDRSALCEVEGVEAVSFVTEQLLLVEYNGRTKLITMRGVDEQQYLMTLPIAQMVSVGDFKLSDERMEYLVLGGSVVGELGIRNLSNIELQLYSLKMGRLQSLLPIGSEVRRSAMLSGVVTLDEESEQSYGYASRGLINDIVGREDALSRVVLSVAQGADVGGVKLRLQRLLGDRFKVESREELNPALYEIIRFEKLGVLLISTMVMLLAAFSLMGALAMLIIEKRSDISRLRAMGLSRRDLRRIFIYEGLLISGVAILAGVVLGVVLTLLQRWFGFVQMPLTTTYGSQYPVELQLGDVVSVVVISAAISVVLSHIVVRVMMRRGENLNIF